VGGDTPKLQEVADLIWEAALNADTPGRVLAAGNQALPRPDDPMGVVWQSVTTLRDTVATDTTPLWLPPAGHQY
jgi:hypothetical protein